MTAPNALYLGFYLLFYAFLGWTVEVICCVAARRRFCNRGFSALPFMLSYGVTFLLLILVLPTVGSNHLIGYLITLVVSSVVDALSTYFTGRVSARISWEPERSRVFSGSGKGFLYSALIAAVFYLTYQIVHPLVMVLVLLLPELAVRIVVAVLGVLLALDYAAMFYALRTGDVSRYEKRMENNRQEKMAHRLTGAVWKRLLKAYPGIQDASGEEQKSCVFAKGLCLDKLIWVFLVTALLGDIIETLYCGLVDGQWMNRSSVLYGPFSFVWGLGAVVLTVTLQRLAGKNDRYVFLAGFVIGGTYEYMCSVFTELVFGTVFWDYSDMPLNIGGRTNVLFCFFWGVLAVVWVKLLYPPMSGGIERLPALAGKLVTWAVLFFMICNGLLTGAVMLRYSARAIDREPANILEEFLDQHYDDGYVERRWPNMIVAGDAPGQD